MKKEKPLILVVDDIPKNLQVIGKLLSKKGYEVAFAENGSEALLTLENAIPDLILLDIMMPEMNGYEVAEKILNNPNTKNIPFIFLTGRADIDDIIKGFKSGAVDYITKPFNALELLSRVNTHISLKLSRDKLKKQNIELETTREELEKTIASKDKFFSIIAHDLKGPFSGFIGLSSMLADDIKDFTQEEIEAIGRNMQNAANKLYSLLDNLLNWSRTQTGGMQYEPEKLNLSKIIKNNFSVLKHIADNKNISFTSEIDETTFVYADENMLSTILRNLITNSIKFSNPGGSIRIYCEKTADFNTITIEDNGIGMSSKTQKSIFKIEKRVSSRGTQNEQGTGLGLLLCKELVEMHGGTISLESTQNVGTKFFFTIPNTKQ